MNPFILGLHGLKRSGKDTFAEQFCRTMQEVNNAAWHINSFADPLRKLGQAMFGINEANREVEIPGIGKTGRQFLQIVGTEVVRQFHPDTWVKSFAHRISGERLVVCTDVRFNNEAQYIKDNGGLIVHIRRPDLESLDKDAHVSEAGISHKYIDVGVSNEGTLEDYKRLIDMFVYDFVLYCENANVTPPPHLFR